MGSHKMVTKSAEKLKNFDDDYDHTSIPRLPKGRAGTPNPKIKLGKKTKSINATVNVGVFQPYIHRKSCCAPLDS